MTYSQSFILLLALGIILQTVSCNWDEATNHLRDYGPSDYWLSKHKPRRCTNEIQIAECARNTRLPFPYVQIFAHFRVNHHDDGYLGCPYGTCCGYDVMPSPEDMVPDFANQDSFFWYHRGGMEGTGTNYIANPQTGGWVYETSDGKMHPVQYGKPDNSHRENEHDKHYPKFNLPQAWPKLSYPPPLEDEPGQAKCGTATGKNLDRGQITLDKYKPYVPAPASSYLPPPASRSFLENGKAAPDSSYLSSSPLTLSKTSDPERSRRPYNPALARFNRPPSGLRFSKILRSRKQK